MNMRVRASILVLSAILIGACSSNSKPEPNYKRLKKRIYQSQSQHQ